MTIPLIPRWDPSNALGILNDWVVNQLNPNAGGGSSGGLSTATVSLSSAQILSSYTSPITVVAGIANRTLAPIYVEFDYTHVTTDYTSDNFPTINYAGHLTNNERLLFDEWSWSELSGSSVSTGISIGPKLDGITNVKGLGLVFTTSGPSALANPTGGDGTMFVTVLYQAF